MQQALQPAERDLFELGRRRRGSPEHRLLIQRSRQELCEDPGSAGRDREVGEEPRVIPVRHARQDDVFEVAEDRVEGLAGLGRFAGQLSLDVAGRHLRENRVSGRGGEIIGDPVRQAVRLAAERLRIHVAEPLCSHIARLSGVRAAAVKRRSVPAVPHCAFRHRRRRASLATARFRPSPAQ